MKLSTTALLINFILKILIRATILFFLVNSFVKGEVSFIQAIGIVYIVSALLGR